jgi:myo-inositol 2-dehydrogenase/D-chiro-inositol 1-dehydrogenase
MGEDHARLLANDVPGVALVALHEPSPERLASVRAHAPHARLFETPEALIQDDIVDAIVVASPDSTHAGLAIASIRAGKPVLVEKPLGATPDEARSVVAEEVAGGLRLVQVGFMRRFDPGYRALRETVEAKTLGEPLLLHCVHRNAAAPHYIGSDLIIANSAVHEFDIVRFLLGEKLSSISVTAARPSRHAAARRPLLLVLESAGGVVVTIEAFLDARYGYDVQAELVFEEGVRSLAPLPPIAGRTAGLAGHRIETDWRGRFVDAYRVQLRDFVRFAAGGPAVG